MFVRQEHFFRTDSLPPAKVIDTSVYDLAGRYDGVTATTCGAGEIPQFIFNDSATSDELAEGKPLRVVFLGHGLVSLKLKGSGDSGNKVKVDSTGAIVASATADNAALAATDFGVALESWSDGDETLVTILRGGI